MNIHSVIAYFQYRWNALTRHDIHSPFIYEFIERILRDKSLDCTTAIPSTTSIPNEVQYRYRVLLQRMISFYHYDKIQVETADSETDPLPCDMLVMTAEPKVWTRLFNRYWQFIKPNGCIMIAGVHKTKRHSAKWRRLCNHPKVRCSIDLYGIGLLFCKEEFKEKQHFILKY